MYIAKLEEILQVAPDEYGWRTLRSGDRVNLGDGVRLGDGVQFERSPLQIQGTRDIAYHAGGNLIGVGCMSYTREEWAKLGDEKAAEEDYSPEEVAEYKRHLDYIQASIQKESTP